MLEGYWRRRPRPRFAGGVSSVLSRPRRRLPFFGLSSGVGLPEPEVVPFSRIWRSILSFHSSSFSSPPFARL